MKENKTVPTKADVMAFLAQVDDPRKRHDSEKLIKILQEISGEPPVLWGSSIIGFGSYHYKYASGREGDAPALGFSPRKAQLTIYVADGFEAYGDLLDVLGKHKTSVGCLYITTLDDVREDVLRDLLTRSYKRMTEKG